MNRTEEKNNYNNTKLFFTSEIACKMRSILTREQKGLTLVEVLIASSIAIVVGTLLLNIMVNSTNIFYKESAKVNIGLNTNDALALVRKSVKESRAVAVSYVIGTNTYTSGETQLVLQLPSLDSSGNIILGVFDYFVFFQEQTKLVFKTSPSIASSRKAQDQILLTNANNLFFQYFNSENPPIEVLPISATKVRITLTLKEKRGSDYEINTATSEANLRNE